MCFTYAMAVLNSNRVFSKCGLNKQYFRQNLSFLRNFSLWSSFRQKEAAEIVDEEQIIIPKRIDRGSTDILRALANITKKDPTASHYKYHDDPYLIPASSLNKRSFALSKEAGRKAAKYFMDNYPQYFFRDHAEPKVEAFSYKDVFDENTQVDESDLKNCIVRHEVENAMIIYNNLTKQSTQIDNELLVDLLELVTFTNCNELPSDFDTEERFFGQNEKIRKTWKDNGFAETLFDTLEKTDRAYCAIIQGMSKFYQAERAFSYYENMREEGFKGNVETYNNLFNVVSFIRESNDARWKLVEDLLTNMKNDGIKPNIRTFNAVLSQISKFTRFHNGSALSLRVMVEMKKLRIRPSLATFYHLLSIYYKDKRGSFTSPILYEIIDEIEDKEFEIMDSDDVLFFEKAMDICKSEFADTSLAYRLHDIAWNGNNYKFIGNGWHQTLFYSKFLSLLSLTEEVNKLMDVYRQIVPQLHAPDSTLLSSIIDAVILHEAFEYLPQLWNDAILLDLETSAKVVEKILHGISLNKMEDPILQKNFVKIASEVIQKFDQYRSRKRIRISPDSIDLSGELLGQCLKVYLNGNEMGKAFDLLQRLDKEKDLIFGIPSAEVLQNFALRACENNKIDMAMKCIKYSSSVGLPSVGSFILTKKEELQLNPTLITIITKLIENVDE